MSEFETVTSPIEDTNAGEVLKNIKELKIGNGRWKVDETALRLYDENNNVIIYLGIDT